MRTRIHWIVASLLVVAGLVCLMTTSMVIGNALIVAGCAAYAAGLALGPWIARTPAVVRVDNER